MSTLKQTMDVLDNPHLYTKKARRGAVKIAISILDKMAESEKEPSIEADGKKRCICQSYHERTGNHVQDCPCR